MKLHDALLCLTLATWPAGAFAAAGHAHEHGAAKIDVAIDGPTLSFDIEMPLDNLLGFEHAPRNAAEQQAADAAVARFKAADGLFKPDPAAGCSLGQVELESAALQLGGTATAGASASASAPSADDGHADLDAFVTFTCADTTKAAFVDITLFDAFPRLQRLDVQMATPKGQLKRTLKRANGSAAARLALRR